ncbi:MAG: hypothetical protein FD147_830, partial [Chloroflexi bacterium]
MPDAARSLQSYDEPPIGLRQLAGSSRDRYDSITVGIRFDNRHNFNSHTDMSFECSTLSAMASRSILAQVTIPSNILLTCSLFPKYRDFDLKKSNLGTLKGGLDELELRYGIHS